MMPHKTPSEFAFRLPHALCSIDAQNFITNSRPAAKKTFDAVNCA
jgi:hypothetical protein